MRYAALKDAVWAFIDMAADAHDAIWRAVRRAGLRVSDKDLHFWVFGIAGALLFALAWRLFWRLRRHPGVAAFLFSFMTMALLALAVEMGQAISGTGAMQLSDIAAGMAGFLVFGCALALAAGAVLGLRRLLRRRGAPKKRK